MHVIRQLDALPDDARHGAVAIGNFDGVHQGHARIIRQLLERAEEVGGPAVVFTFDPHPVRLLRPGQCPPPLTWTERKAELLKRLGVDWVIAYPTDRELLNLSARGFFDLIVRDSLKAKAMVEGPNFYFGKNREGTIEVLRGFTAEAGMTLDVVEPVVDSHLSGPSSSADGDLVSSSRIRKCLIEEGDVAAATKMLTAPYRVRGMVTHGEGRGAKLGFPTANLSGIDTLLPADGVYAGIAITETASFPTAINIGPNPTFDHANAEPPRKVEAHVIGFDGSLYGKPIEVDFLARLRAIRKFGSAEELVQQVQQDVATANQTGTAWLKQAHS